MVDNIVSEYLKYDPTTGVISWTKPPRKGVGTKKPAGTQSNGYIQISIKGHRLLAHRVAWFLYYREWPKSIIDHINGLKNDNRIENLRMSDKRNNAWNMKSHRMGKLAGSTKIPNKNLYCGRIRLNGKRYDTGCSSCPEISHLNYLLFYHLYISTI